jgi:hypothetical protein
LSVRVVAETDADRAASLRSSRRAEGQMTRTALARNGVRVAAGAAETGSCFESARLRGSQASRRSGLRRRLRPPRRPARRRRDASSCLLQNLSGPVSLPVRPGPRLPSLARPGAGSRRIICILFAQAQASRPVRARVAGRARPLQPLATSGWLRLGQDRPPVTVTGTFRVARQTAAGAHVPAGAQVRTNTVRPGRRRSSGPARRRGCRRGAAAGTGCPLS